MDKVAVVPTFLTSRAQLALIKCVLDPVYETSRRWVHLRGRKLMQFGGRPVPGPALKGKEPLPGWLEAVVDELVRVGAFPPEARPNHVLVNLYAPGQGILPHTDGPLYHPLTATLSLGSPAVMAFRPAVPTSLVGTPEQVEREERLSFSVGLPEGCLVLFSGEAYHALHEIPATVEDVVDARCANRDALGWKEGSVIQRKAIRISLTIRHVPVGKAEDAATASAASSSGGD